ncbi:AraC family transcriptional regulator [Caballeronia sp. 15715]|uniref:AraC family transcriptional regulator n=1 Tax=Caballeronia sp. 15715 TaxID=3391030 RepID=UPI0039E6B259
MASENIPPQHAAINNVFSNEPELQRPLPLGDDALSQILKFIRLRGDVVFDGELGVSAEVRFAAGPASFLHMHSGEVVISHSHGQQVLLQAGDLVLLPHGNGHTLGAKPGEATAERFEAEVSFLPALHTRTQKWGTRGDVAARFLAGAFYFEGGPLQSLLSGLPGLIHLQCDEAGVPPWLAAISHFLTEESRDASPGSLLMISRLIDLLVIRTLRTWVNHHGDRIGWLSGLSDERIGRALNAIHLQPSRAWTVESLAGIAAMSRSIFSDRFTAAVGLPPLRYLTRWRLTVAADLLRTGKLKVTEVAHNAGYGSEAAFSRAYKTQFGYPPSDTHRIAQSDVFQTRSSAA